jgi:hypothetical protein
MKYLQSITVMIVVLLASNILFAIDPKEVISRNLDSIASAEKRKALSTLFAMGFNQYESKVPVVKGGGKAIVVSDPENLYILMSFNSRDYPYEKIGAFHKNVNIPYITPGRRSTLGSFLIDNSRVLTENLFFGSMSLRWIDHIDDMVRVKMKSADTKKINGRDAYAIDVSLSGSDSGSFRVRLFFDTENFHHLRTEYHREVDIGGITFKQQNQAQNARVDVTEDFSEYNEVDGFTLPYIYKVTLTSNSDTQSYETSWTVKVANYYLNQKLAPDFFSFESN